MIRKTLTILSLMGLLLSVGLWGVSYHGPFCLTDHFLLQVWKGGIGVLYMEDGFPMTHRRWGIYGFDGFETYWLPSFTAIYPRNLMIPFRSVTIPLWMLCLLFAALPAYSLPPIRRRRKRKKLGLCLKCGYDLRASRDRCPECGEAFEKT